MIGKSLMMAACTLALTAPAMAQTTTGGQTDPAQSGTMSNGTMPTDQSSGMMSNSSGMATMSKSDMAAMKRCKAMSSDMAAKNKKCTMLMQKYPDSSSGSM